MNQIPGQIILLEIYYFKIACLEGQIQEKTMIKLNGSMEQLFDRGGFQSFGNDFTRNIIFGVDNSSSSLAGNCKNNLLILDEGPISDINVLLYLEKVQY